MRKAILFSLITLIVGFGLGYFARYYIYPIADDAPLRSTMNVVASTTTPVETTSTPEVSLAEEVIAIDRTDNALLLEAANQVLVALKYDDFTTLSTLVHPEKGVTFTPYSTVQPDIDLCFTPGQIAKADSDTTAYVWGVTDGSGLPIESTIVDYIDQYVYNADFTQAPQIGIDTIITSGNAMENVLAVFPQGRFVEYHFSGIDPELQGYDWCSLKLVFEIYDNQWVLVGLIHSQWTI